ncbi:hypothetical protein BZL54_31350 [Burkholderia ubonensis subsp. mesacidophila]|uniref:Glycosyl transferase family 1 domain-containing protein n=1 Tax=Burkholderia ubonensis subsp. mesacidophila TaxID=265293 RepID=A0A2A4F0K7_9BURK|nr:hypothetical protein BZL54_31350 [Burkholderia ubonensis subsp. mesacidophila]
MTVSYATYRRIVSDVIIVDREGLTGDVEYLLKHDPLAKDLAEIHHGVENDELTSLIDNCLFAAFPAIYERWGLPACEIFHYGKVCATSNTARLPEIIPFEELRFDPYEPRQAFEVMRSLIESPERLHDFAISDFGEVQATNMGAVFR